MLVFFYISNKVFAIFHIHSTAFFNDLLPMYSQRDTKSIIMMYPVRPKRVFKLFVILVIAICLAPCIIFYGKRESYDKGETSGASASGRSGMYM